MKHCLTLIFLVIALRLDGQNNPSSNFYFDRTVFEKAKIKNEDASVFFSQNVHYPYNSLVDGYSDGNVFVSFIVRKDGQIDSVQILNEQGELFKDTVLDALNKSSGLWNPCNFDGILFDKKYLGAFNFTTSHSFFYKKDKSQLYLKTGRIDKALKFVNQALKINPFDIELYKWRASIYRSQKMYDLEMLDLAIIQKLDTDLLFNIWF